MQGNEASILFKIAVDSNAATAEWRQTTQAMAGGLKTVETGLGSVSKATQQMSAAGASATQDGKRQSAERIAAHKSEFAEQTRLYREAASALKKRLADEAKAARETAAERRRAMLDELREAERIAKQREKLERQLAKIQTNAPGLPDAFDPSRKRREELQAEIARLRQLETATKSSAERRAKIEADYAAEVRRINTALANAQRNIEAQRTADVVAASNRRNQAVESEKRAMREAAESSKGLSAGVAGIGKESAASGVAFGNIASAAVLGALQTAKDTVVELAEGVVRLGVETSKTAKDQDNLQRLFGLSDSQAGALIYTLGGAGDAFDALGQLNSNLQDATKNGGDTAERFKALGIAFDDGAGKARNVGDVLTDIQGKAKQGFSKPELATLGQILGDDTAKKLLPTLENLDAVGQKALDAGAILQGDAKRSALEFAAKLQELDIQLLGLKTTVGAELIPVLQQVTPEISKLLRELLAIVKNNPELFDSLAKITGLIARTATPALAAFLKFVEANVVGLQSLAKFAASAFAFLSGDTRKAVAIFSEAAAESDKATKKFAELIPALATIRKAFAEIGTGFREAAKGNFGQAAQSFLDAKNTFGQAAGEIKTAVGNLIGGITGTGMAAQVVDKAVAVASPAVKQLTADYRLLSAAQADYAKKTGEIVGEVQKRNADLVAEGRKSAVDSAAEVYGVVKARTDQEIKLAETAYQARLRLIEQETGDEKTKNAAISKARLELEATTADATKRRTDAQRALETALADDEKRIAGEKAARVQAAEREAQALAQSETARLRQLSADQRLAYEQARLMGADEVALVQIKIEQEQAYVSAQIEGLRTVLEAKQSARALDENNLQLKGEIADIEAQITDLLAQQASIAAGAGERIREALEKVKSAAGDAADGIGKVGEKLDKVGEVSRRTQAALGQAFDPKSAESLDAAILQVRQNIQALTALGFYNLAKPYQDQLQELFKLRGDLGREADEAERERRRQLADDLNGIADEQASREAQAQKDLDSTLDRLRDEKLEEERGFEESKRKLADETDAKVRGIEAKRAAYLEGLRQEDLQRALEAEREKQQAIADLRERSDDDAARSARDRIRRASDLRAALVEIEQGLTTETDPTRRGELLKQQEDALAEQRALDDKATADKERQAEVEAALTSGKSADEIAALVDAANKKYQLRTEEIDDLLEARRNGDAAELAELEAFYAEQRKRAEAALEQRLSELADKERLETEAREKERADRLAGFDQEITDTRDAAKARLDEMTTTHLERLAELKRQRVEARAEYKAQMDEILADTKARLDELKVSWSDYAAFVKGQLGQISPTGPTKTDSSSSAGAGAGSGGSSIRTGTSPSGPSSSTQPGSGGPGNGQRRTTTPTPAPAPTGGPSPQSSPANFAEVGQTPFGEPKNKADRVFNRDARPVFVQAVNLLRKGDAAGARANFDVLRDFYKRFETSLSPEFASGASSALSHFGDRLAEAEGKTGGSGKQIVQDHARPNPAGDASAIGGGLKADGTTITRPGGTNSATTKPTGTASDDKSKPKPYDNATEYQSIPGPAQPILAHLSNKEIDQAEAERQWKALIGQNDALGRFDKVVMARIAQLGELNRGKKREAGGEFAGASGPAGDAATQDAADRERAQMEKEASGKSGGGTDADRLRLLSIAAVQRATSGGGGNFNAIRDAAQQSIARSVPEGAGTGASGVIPKQAAEAVKQAGGKGGDVNMIIQALPDYDETERRVLKSLKEAHEAIYGRR